MDAKETIEYLYEHGHIVSFEHYKTICDALNKSITEHPDVQRLIKQVVELQKRIDKMTVNGLSPESRLNGYSVVADKQIERIKELCVENERLITGINKAIQAIQDPLNNKAIIDTLWMPDMQACTVVDYLLILTN